MWQLWIERDLHIWLNLAVTLSKYFLFYLVLELALAKYSSQREIEGWGEFMSYLDLEQQMDEKN